MPGDPVALTGYPLECQSVFLFRLSTMVCKSLNDDSSSSNSFFKEDDRFISF